MFLLRPSPSKLNLGISGFTLLVEPCVSTGLAFCASVRCPGDLVSLYCRRVEATSVRAGARAIHEYAGRGLRRY